jgi:predicted lipoprotein with Yx(FWY)xxD motif
MREYLTRGMARRASGATLRHVHTSQHCSHRRYAPIWPPLTLPAGTATTVPGVTGIGTTTNGGRVQVTEMNQPLYRFSGDTKPGGMNGDGIISFGGQWQAVRSGGVVPNTAPSSTGGGSSGGYGY